MRRLTMFLVATAVLLTLSAAAVVAGETPEKTDGFVCPVLGGQAGDDHGNSSPSRIVAIAGGDYTVGGPDVSVPVHATNDNGAGSPGGDHTSPGDAGYTAIWARN